MSTARNYRELVIYQESLDLAREVYLLTKSFPKDETYGMRDQVRRAVASIGANIAEGFGRFHYKDKLLFFYNSRGSLFETMHFLELASQVGYINKLEKDGLLLRLEKLSVRLNNFIKAIGDGN